MYEMCALVPPFRADDMNGLFKRVLKGSYPQIPTHYSMEIRSVIKSLIQVNPASRPTTDQILDMPIVAKRIKKYFKDDGPSSGSIGRDGTVIENDELLKTIKFSKNLFKLKLPQATYEQLSFATMPAHSKQSKARNSHGAKTQHLVEKQV
jgi:serine/threonine protein kinase